MSESAGRPPYTFRPPMLPAAIEEALRRFNPWWDGVTAITVPLQRRHLVKRLRYRMDLGLARIVSLRGPRQVGKSTAHLQLISDLLQEGVLPTRIMRVEFDQLPAFPSDVNPILLLADWFEHYIVGKHFNTASKEGQPAYLFLDEVQIQYLWSSQLKVLVDNASVRVFMTGSSALAIEAGRESLAGRITTLECGPLSLSEIADFRGLGPLPAWGQLPYLNDLIPKDFWLGLRDHGRQHAAVRDEAFAAFSRLGAYPWAHQRPDRTWNDVADYLRESVIARVIEHDALGEHTEVPWRAALVEELTRTVVRYAGQAPGADTIDRALRAQLGQSVDLGPVPEYLRALDNSLLLRLVRALEVRVRGQKAGTKICLADPTLRAAWLGEVVPLDPATLATAPDHTTLAGYLAESTTGAWLAQNYGLSISWLPQRNDSEPEVDFIINPGDVRIPIEVKYQARVDPVRDTTGLRRFMDEPMNRSTFGLLVTRTDVDLDLDPRIVQLPLSTLMLLR
jgi:predicted AAA+ superfamily ATPase